MVDKEDAERGLIGSGLSNSGLFKVSPLSLVELLAAWLQ